VSALRPIELLALWEHAADVDVHHRTVALTAEQSDRPLGRSHAALLELHELLAGPMLTATVNCPRCSADVEFSVQVADLTVQADKIDDNPTPVICGQWVVTWRPPSAADLAAVAPAERTAKAAVEADLLARCVLAADGPSPLDHGRDLVRDLPVQVRAALVEAIAAADPLAEIRFELSCPDCCLSFHSDIDVPEFVWTELDHAARALLVEIATLARAFGWTEPDVLALSPARRSAYLRITEDGLP